MPKKTDKTENQDKTYKLKSASKQKFEGNTDREGEGSLYDKIMRENLRDLYLPLIAEELNVKIKSVSSLPDKQPTTVLRETDAFLLIETYSKTEPKFILHLEFESKDNEEMIYRMMEYHGIELRKYRLPIKHVVVYLGEGTPKMRTKLRKEEVFEGFTLVNAHSFSPQKWLEEEEPSKIIMAILGDYEKKDAELIVDAIVLKLRRVCKTNAELQKFIEQLIIISRMRNLEELTIKKSKAMPITIDIEKDYLYKLGLKKSEEIATEFKEAFFKASKRVDELSKEKAALAAKAKADAAKAKADAAKAKAAAEKAKTDAAKVKADVMKAKAEFEAKAKAEFEAKAKAEKTSIQKMKSKNKLSDEEIMDFLSLDKATYEQYLKEISENPKK